MEKCIWITWEFHRRNRGISEALGCSLYEIINENNMIFRYLYSFVKTVVIIQKEKPKILIVQNPSIFLSLLAVLIKPIYSYQLIVDAHNSGIYPCEGKYKILSYISVYIQKKSNIVLVTNENLAHNVRKNKGNPVVMPDCIPKIQNISKTELDGKFCVVFITTYNVDEPYLEVINAAKMIDKKIVIYFTGNPKNKLDSIDIPYNVKICGFLREDNYWKLLRSCSIVMDLTTRKDCLVCGAYEALSLNKPLILSNTHAIKKYFNRGVLYVDPNDHSISNAVNKAFRNIEFLRSEIIELKKELNNDMHYRVKYLREKIEIK
jgi:hypothetical protein